MSKEFYPYLFEDVEENSLDVVKEESAESKELTQSQISTILGKYVITSPNSSIILDPNTFEIITVDKKTRNSPISNWEDVTLNSNGKSKSAAHRNKLIDYIQYEMDQIGADLDVNSVIESLDKNKKGAKKKTYEPLPIPNFPEGLTFGKFWDYQEDNNADDIIKDIEGFEGKKSSGSSIKDSALLAELNVPLELTEFYEVNGKAEEFEKFLKNTSESKGASIIGEMSGLFEIMAEVVTGNITRKSYKVKKGIIDLALKSKTDIEHWKSDMLEYIGKYDNNNIGDINNGVYLNKIKKSGSFLGILMNIEPSGMGRGEVLIAYIMEGAQFAGGGESYDITCIENGDVTYELKDYSDSGGSIRLGAHGALTRFSWWKEMEKTIMLARKIKNELGDKKLKELLDKDSGMKQFYKIWELVASEKPYQNNRIVGSAIDAGEINSSKLSTLKVFYALVNEFLKVDPDAKSEEYTYATIKGDNVSPKTIAIKPIKTNKLDKAKNLELNSDTATNADLLKFKELSTIKYVQDPTQMQIDMDSIGEEYSESSNVDFFMVFLPKRVAIDKLNEYVFDTISQKAVKIIHKDELSQSKKEQPAEKAFNKWKGQQEKSFYDIYQKTVAGVNEGVVHGFYPQLF